MKASSELSPEDLDLAVRFFELLIEIEHSNQLSLSKTV